MKNIKREQHQQPVDRQITNDTVGMWYLPLNKESDWSGVLQKKGHSECHLVCRFRYYSADSSSPFDGKDRKSWYTMVIKQSPAESIAAVRFFVDFLRKQYGLSTPYDEVLNAGNLEDFMQQITSRPWAHSSTEPVNQEQAAKLEDRMKEEERWN